MEKKELTTAQAVGIGALGALVGLIPILLLSLAIWVEEGGSSNPYLTLTIFGLLIFLAPLAILGAIIGAVIGKKWKNSKTAIWIGAVLGTILGTILGVATFWARFF